MASPNKGAGGNVLRNPSSWANFNLPHDAVSGSDPLIVSSSRDELRMSHSRVRDERGHAWDFLIASHSFYFLFICISTTHHITAASETIYIIFSPFHSFFFVLYPLNTWPGVVT